MTDTDSGGGKSWIPAFASEIAARVGEQGPWGPLAGLAVGLLLLALAARDIDLRAAGQAMGQADPLWVGLGLLTVLLSIAARVVRWRELFGESHTPRHRSLARALVVGKLLNTLLPARLGEVGRFYILGRDEGLSKATVAGTIAAEKVFDLLFLVLAAGLTAAFVPVPPWLTGSLTTGAGVGAAVFVAAVALPHRWIRAATRRLASWLPETAAVRLVSLVDSGLVGLESLRRQRLAMRASIWSAVVWGLGAGANATLLQALNLPVSAGAALLVLTLVNAGTIVPTSPGELGVFHALTLMGLQSLAGAQWPELDRADGLAYATLLHAVVYGPRIVLGALALGMQPIVKRWRS